jgi:hypothetical protein
MPSSASIRVLDIGAQSIGCRRPVCTVANIAAVGASLCWRMNEYLARMEAQLKKWDADLEVLAAEGQKASDGARAAYHERLKALRANRDAARQTFEALRAATGAAGSELQAGMKSAWETMQNALEKAAAELRK